MIDWRTFCVFHVFRVYVKQSAEFFLRFKLNNLSCIVYLIASKYFRLYYLSLNDLI